MFTDDLRNNVSAWDEDVDDTRLQAALEAAQISQVVEDLPDKLETKIGDDAVNLSGGQRQRLSLAREFYRDAQILILDEPMSAIDIATEKFITNAIAKHREGRTVVMIAHRLASLVECDVIHVLKNGTIVESGTFAELSDASGEFSRLLSNVAQEGEAELSPE